VTAFLSLLNETAREVRWSCPPKTCARRVEQRRPITALLVRAARSHSSRTRTTGETSTSRLETTDRDLRMRVDGPRARDHFRDRTEGFGKRDFGPSDSERDGDAPPLMDVASGAAVLAAARDKRACPHRRLPLAQRTISRRLGRGRRRCRIARDSCRPRRPRVSSSGHQSFEEPLDTLSTTPGRRSPGPFCRDRGGSTFA